MFELPPEKKWQLYLSKKKVRWARKENKSINQRIFILKPVDSLHDIE